MPSQRMPWGNLRKETQPSFLQVRVSHLAKRGEFRVTEKLLVQRSRLCRIKLLQLSTVPAEKAHPCTDLILVAD
jgi:hypothetical protein